MSGQGYEQLTLFPEDSHASRSVLPGSEEARTMTVTSGQRCLELYRNSGQLGLLVKMLLGSSIWRSTRCLLTWKVSATPAKRLLFRLAPSMPHTEEADAQFWPTPRAQEWKDVVTSLPPSRIKDKGKDNLTQRVARSLLYPTPTARMGKAPSNTETRQGAPDLQTVVGGQLNPLWVEWLMGFPIGWTDLNALETQ